MSSTTSESDTFGSSYSWDLSDLDLIFADEFDDIGGGPDPSSWEFNVGPAGSWYNNEEQGYEDGLDVAQIIDVDETANVNGALRITASNVNGDLTSARVKSKIEDVGPYGYYEIRAKLPSEQGAWPALWLLGDLEKNTWPLTGEIDIVEWSSVKHDEVTGNQIMSALHFADRHGGNPVTEAATLDSAVDNWHIYQLWWTPDAIKIGVDGTVRLTHTWSTISLSIRTSTIGRMTSRWT